MAAQFCYWKKMYGIAIDKYMEAITLWRNDTKMNKPYPKIKILIKNFKVDAEVKTFLKKGHNLQSEKRGQLPEYVKIDLRISKILNAYAAAPLNNPIRIETCLKPLVYIAKFDLKRKSKMHVYFKELHEYRCINV